MQFPGRVWLNTLHCTAARHVRPLDRSSAMGEARSQRSKFENKIHNLPVGALEHKCLEAGLHRMPGARPGAQVARKWQGQGPFAGIQFFRVKLYNPLVGQGCLVRHPNLESTPLPPPYLSSPCTCGSRQVGGGVGALWTVPTRIGPLTLSDRPASPPAPRPARRHRRLLTPQHHPPSTGMLNGGKTTKTSEVLNFAAPRSRSRTAAAHAVRARFHSSAECGAPPPANPNPNHNPTPTPTPTPTLTLTSRVASRLPPL